MTKFSTRSVWTSYFVAAIAVAASSLGISEAREDSPMTLATDMVRSSGLSGGICAVVGPANADLALAIARQGNFVVHVLCSDSARCGELRKAIRSHGMYGTVSAHVFGNGRLPYADNLVNLVVMRDAGYGIRDEEITRVLAPGGVALVLDGKSETENRKWTKPVPPNIDEWTHYLHGADGNPVARDRVVGPPEHYQWIAGPMWQRSHETDSSISTVVTASGRLFFIIDEAPISMAGNHSLPDKWFLVARDAFNGVLLWKVPIRRWGWREWKDTWFTNRPGDFPLNRQKRLVAVGDKVYVTLGYHAPVSELDARTGEILQTYKGTERTGEILYENGTLILSVLGDGNVRVMAVDAATGTKKWETDGTYRGSTVDYLKFTSRYASLPAPTLDPSLNTATDGNVVALLDGPDVVCLDFLTGKEKWRTHFPADEADRTAGGIQTQGNLWIGTMIVSNDAVIHASPNKLAALSAATGEVLWSQPKKYIGHLWYEWKDVFVIDGLVWTWSAELDNTTIDTGAKKQRSVWPVSANGYDIKTGELKKEVALGPIFRTHHHHRCYRNKATLKYILASRRGTEFVDLENGRHTVHNWVRGTCHVGMMPANGLQYIPPHPCQCYIEEKLSGFTALAGTSKAKSAEPTVEKRLVQGPAYGKIGNRQSEIASASDWPTFRHDAMRTGSVQTQVPDNAELLWRVKAGNRVSPAVIVGDSLFASLIDEHHVVCLDVRDGTKQWEFAAGARIDSPPTYHEGTVLFGSADGSAYCLRADNGQLVWRFRAAPEERLIGAFGQLESAWPVHGSVLVQNGIAYFSAGRSSQLDGGIYLYGLDGGTGELRYETKLAGPDYAIDTTGKQLVCEQPSDSGDGVQKCYDENYRLPTGALSDILMGDGEHVYMRSLAFDTELKPAKGTPEMQTKSGFLEDSYFKRTPWTFGSGKGSEYARLLVRDSRSVYFVRMFDTLRGLDPTVYFTPGAKGYLLFAKNMKGDRSTWSERISVRVRAMALAGERLFVAGPPDVVDPKDPLGAFEGRKGGLLYVVDTTKGEKSAEHVLASPPGFNGMAAANGRLFVTEEDGSIACFGGK